MIGTMPGPVIFAHRGASAHAPENTLSSFRLAKEQGAEAIELDVQITADMEIVVFHDLTLNRVTNTSGKISDYTLADLKKMDAGYAYGPAFQTERIPTLEEVFKEFSDFPLINVELKNFSPHTEKLPVLVADIIHSYQMETRVLISSFNPKALRNFNKLSSEILLGRLVHFPLTLRYFQLNPSQLDIYNSVHISYSVLNPHFIKYFHSKGKLVYTYTLNHPGDMIEALELGVDGFFTDDPGLAKRTIINSNN